MAKRRIFRRLRDAVGRIPSAIDSAIYAVAPVWGARRIATRRRRELMERQAELLRRKQDRVTNSSWSGAESDRTSANKWLASRLSPDAALESDLRTLQERCDELYRDNEIAHGAVEGRVANEVGTGILPQARVEEAQGITADQAELINAALEDVARRWSEAGVDRTGVHSLAAVEKLIVRQFASLGESFVQLGASPGRRPLPLVLDVIHPFRIETPAEFASDENVRLGIRYDDEGQVLGYYVCRSHPYETSQLNLKYDYVPRIDAAGQARLVHVFDPLFAGQSRGLPWMGAAIKRIKDAGDVVEYTILAMQIEACFAAFVKASPGQSPHELATGTHTSTDTEDNRLEELRPGAIEYLGADQDVAFASPQRPGSTFLPMIEFCLRSIAAALDYPYELLAQNFARVTFSSGRLSMMGGRLGFAMRRVPVIEKGLTPIWKRLVTEAVLAGELGNLIPAVAYAARPHLYQRHQWQARSGMYHVNPEQERKAQKLAVDEGFATLADVWAEEGKDWEQGLVQRDRELSMLVEQRTKLEGLQAQLREAAGLPPLPPGVLAGITDMKATAAAAPEAAATDHTEGTTDGQNDQA